MSDGQRSYDSRQTHVSKVSSSSRNDRSVAEPLARSDCVHMLASSATEARPTIVTINVVRPFILKGNAERGDRAWLPSREFRDGNMNQGVTLWYSSGITILQTPCTSPQVFNVHCLVLSRHQRHCGWWRIRYVCFLEDDVGFGGIMRWESP
jgi:hypothetical protein